MRSITAAMSLTLDGVVQGLGRPDEDTRGGFTHGGWGRKYNDQVMGQEMGKSMAKPGDMLFGHRTWRDFITAWAGATDGNPFTTPMNAATKYVVSRTLKDADASTPMTRGPLPVGRRLDRPGQGDRPHLPAPRPARPLPVARHTPT